MTAGRSVEAAGAPAGPPADGVWLSRVEIRGDEFPDRGIHPFDIPTLGRRQSLDFHQSVSFFVGENGSGKSTLIEAMARRCGLHIWAERRRHGAPQAARRPAARAGAPSLLTEYLDVTLTRGPVRGGVFTAESFRQWAEFLDDVAAIDPGQAKFHGGADLTLRSHGEGLMAYFRGRYQIPGLYFLDEPEAALSPASQLDLLRLLAEFQQRGHAQFVLATHSPILMALPGAQVFDFQDTGIVETRCEDTEHFRLYKEFMADPSAFLER